MKIVIVDYGMGNLRSVAKAFEKSGAVPTVSSNARDIESADKLVLPGVGAFPSAVRELGARGLSGAIQEKIKDGTPYLGICLGLQLLFDSSEESGGERHVGGFGIIPGGVKRFKGNMKVPHMGWNTLDLGKKNCPLFKGIKNGSFFYFVHSYFGTPKDKSAIAAKTAYGPSFCSAVWKDNVYATQFHPEKSQGLGLKLIENFIKRC